MQKTLVIIGGGAAGIFAAINAAEANPSLKVIVLEKSPNLLSKVSISGGGRCNVTHHCFDPKALSSNYPRGHKELLGPFSKFQPKDTIQWFLSRGVHLKSEPDGRMFPTSDKSQTIVDCLLLAASKAKVQLNIRCPVHDISLNENHQFIISCGHSQPLTADFLLLASGGSKDNIGIQFAQKLNHTIIPQVPSLFTFNIEDARLNDLQGISFDHATIKILNSKFSQSGPTLITHWGLSGPAILKLSAWAAQDLYQKNYQFDIAVDWLSNLSEPSLKDHFLKLKKDWSKRLVHSHTTLNLPSRFWERIVSSANISPDTTWAHLPNDSLLALLNSLKSMHLHVSGKSTNKDEFVTCGGISLKDVDFKRMESKLCPNLFFAGEILNIDGITGGFNFQAAWTTAFLAAQSISSDIS